MDYFYPKYVKFAVLVLLVLLVPLALYCSSLLFDMSASADISLKIKLNMAVSTLMLFSLSVFLAYSLFKKGDYQAEKSFPIERYDKRKLQVFVKALLAAYIVVVIWDIYANGTNVAKRIGSHIFAFYGFYYVLKSLKHHEDIDYSTNEALVDILGFDINEKVRASYQNFDGSEPNISKGDSLMVITGQKVYFSQFNGTTFESLSKGLQQIEKVGVSRKLEESFLLVVFDDKTTLRLTLNVISKTTTTPQLFIGQFLRTLDDYLLGNNKAVKPRRRRVAVSNETSIKSDNSVPQVRNIDLNPVFMNELKSSAEIKPGRILEI